MIFLVKHRYYNIYLIFKQKITLLIMGVMLYLLSLSYSYAQDINLRVKVTLSQLSSQTKMVQALCTLSQGKSKAYGSDFILPKNGRFDDYLIVPISINKPLSEYKDIRCEIRLCSSTNKLKKCKMPIAASQISGLIKPYNSYADNTFNRITVEQSLTNSLILLHTPPPSYQMAKKDNTGKKKTAKAQQSFSSQAPATLGRAVSDANDDTAAVGTALAVADVLEAANFASVTGLVVGVVGLAGSKLLGASDNEVAQILGDLVGLGFSIVGAAVTTAAEGAAITAGGTILPVVAALPAGYSLGEKLDKFLDQSGKEGNTATLTALEYYFPYDNGDTDEFLAAVAKYKARREAEQNIQNEQNNANTGGDAVVTQPSAGTNFEVGNGQVDQELDTTPVTTSSSSTAPSQDNEVESTSVTDAASSTASSQDNEVESTSVTDAASSSSTAPSQDNEVEATNNQNIVNGVVVGSRTNSDGSYSYTAMVSENTADGGKRWIDVLEITCSGGNCVSIGESGEQEVFQDNNGEAPENGTTVSVALGSGDSSSDNEDDSTSNNDDNTANDESNGNEDGDSSDNDNCSEGSSNCDNDDSEQPADEEEESTTDTETSDNSTPNPNEQDNASDGLAWAMQNPKNPLAKQILKNAANAIIENSGYCKLGCSNDTNEGGLLWAMLNPDNPLAQNILAAAAESIRNNSGRGQAGGSDDNPSIQLEAGEDTYGLEYFLFGGGVVDPVDGDEGTAPIIPGSVAPIIGGGNPTAIQNNKSNIQRDFNNKKIKADDEEGSVSGEQEINVDQENIRSRIR